MSINDSDGLIINYVELPNSKTSKRNNIGYRYDAPDKIIETIWIWKRDIDRKELIKVIISSFISFIQRYNLVIDKNKLNDQYHMTLIGKLSDYNRALKTDIPKYPI